MTEIFKGAAGSDGGRWSNGAAWLDGSVPSPNAGLSILLAVNSTDDLGTAGDPFVARDVIGASRGLTPPALTVSGFLKTNDVDHLNALFLNPHASLSTWLMAGVNNVSVLSDGSLTVGVMVHTQSLAATEESKVLIGAAVDVDRLSVSFGARLEVRSAIGDARLAIGAAGGTIILDRPEHGALHNALSLAFGNDRLELGGLVFDEATFVPSASDPLSGKVQLSEGGHGVYQLSNVTLPTGTGPFSVGIDSETGYHYVQFA